MTRRWLWILIGACLAWPAAAVAQSPIRGLHADRFDVSLTLLPDGSVDVRETVVFRFSEKTFSRVDRAVPIHRFDGVIDVRASLDGRLLAEDDQEQRVRIRQGRDTLRVTWRFPETIDQARTFTLEYRAMGALAVANGRAAMDWMVLPSRHRYLIDEARVEWRVPASIVRVEPTTVNDPRWTTSARADGGAASRTGVGIDETTTLTDAFDATTMAAAVPAWQTNSYRARQMAPAFVIAALTLLVVGAGIIGMTWFRYHVPAQERRGVEPARPDSWPPAIGTALVRGTIPVGPAQMQATLLDLARRGILHLSESREDPKRFDVVMAAEPKARAAGRAHAVRPHEQAVLDVLWLHMKNGRAELRTAWKQLQRAFPAFRRSLLLEMQEGGLVDTERRWAVKGMLMAGCVVLVLGLVGVVVFRIVFGHLGDVPQVVPASVVISGFGFIIASQCLSVLSAAGVAASAEWRARRDWIKAKVKEPMDAPDVAQWFPAAAGFGLATAMLKKNKGAISQGAAAFGWLGAVSDPGAALAVIVASTSGSSHSGGAGGGGSAAGGSSSAS